MDKEKIKAFFAGENQKTAILKDKQNALAEQRQQLCVQIDTLEQALDHPKDYKWYQLSNKVNDKRSAENRLRSAKKELKQVEKQIENLEQEIEKLRSNQKERRIWITVIAVFFVLLVLICTVNALKERSTAPADDDLYAAESIIEDDIAPESTEPESAESATTEKETQAHTNKISQSNSTQTTAKTTKAKQPAKKSSTSAAAKATKSKQHTTTKNRYVAPEDKKSSETVYITDTGHKYHRSGCRFLKSKHAISKKAAIQQGYQPCGTCNP